MKYISVSLELLARKLCELDGYNPDTRGRFAIKVYREGRLTDTGHDTRKGITEECEAPSLWKMYLHKAEQLIGWYDD